MMTPRHEPRAHVYPRHRRNAAGVRVTAWYAGIRRAYDAREALSYCQASREAALAVCQAFLATGARPESGMRRGPKVGSRNSARRGPRITDSAQIGSKSVVGAAGIKKPSIDGKLIGRLDALRAAWRATG